MKIFGSVLIVLAILLMVQTAFTQNVEYVGSVPLDGIEAFAISGNFAYCPLWDSLAIIDISNPASPTLVDQIHLPGYGIGIDINGNYAYVANALDSCLQVLDISNAENPSLLASSNLPDMAYDVYVNGNYAYVADYLSGLQIVDISNPSHPQSVGYYDTPGNAYSVYTLDNYAYVADNRSGLQIINISNPASPILSGNYDTQGRAMDLQIMGDYACVADFDAGMQIINISDPTNPSLAGGCDTWSFAYGIDLFGNYAYIADGDQNFQIIDISNPANPTTVIRYGSIDFAYKVCVYNNYIYVANFSSLLILRFNPTGIDGSNGVPNIFSLSQNYPNPFNPITQINYTLPKDDAINISIYNLLGQKVAILFDGMQNAGEHSIKWNAKDFPSGVYFARLESDGRAENIKMVLLK